LGILHRRDQAVSLEAYHTHTHTHTRFPDSHTLSRGCLGNGDTVDSSKLNDSERLQVAFDNIFCHAVTTVARSVSVSSAGGVTESEWHRELYRSGENLKLRYAIYCDVR
jgi:hypothetical protein